jgi:hypothetical protein
MKLQVSCTYLINNDITAVKLLITAIIEELMAFVSNLENIPIQTVDVTTPCDFTDLANTILHP